MRYGKSVAFIAKSVQLSSLGKLFYAFPDYTEFQDWNPTRNTEFLASMPIAAPVLSSLVFTVPEIDVTVAWLDSGEIPVIAWIPPETHLPLLRTPWRGLEIAPEYIDAFAQNFSKNGPSAIVGNGSLIHLPFPNADVEYLSHLGYHVASTDATIPLRHRVVPLNVEGDGYPFPVRSFDETLKYGVKSLCSTGMSKKGLHIKSLIVTDPALAKNIYEMLGYCEPGTRVQFQCERQIGFDFCHSISLSDVGKFAPLRGQVRIFRDRVRLNHADCPLQNSTSPVTTWYGYDHVSGKTFVTASWLANQIVMNPENLSMKALLGTHLDVDGRELQHLSFKAWKPGVAYPFEDDGPF